MESEVGRKDLASMVPCRPDGICLPKVESAAEISAADIAVLELEQGYGIAEGELRFHAMIESARGLLQAPAIAAASPRLATLIFGSADFIQDVRCDPGADRVELLLALEHIVLAARAAGLDAIDAPCFELRDQDRLRREATQARRIGFDGKSALHPAQLEIINQVFEVTSDQIAWAEKVVAELNQAEARGRALSTLDGMLIDNPHRAAADRILRRAALAKLRPQVTG
jgi:citrate lyase subunit beta/citryl-CoA lyase